MFSKKTFGRSYLLLEVYVKFYGPLCNEQFFFQYYDYLTEKECFYWWKQLIWAQFGFFDRDYFLLSWTVHCQFDSNSKLLTLAGFVRLNANCGNSIVFENLIMIHCLDWRKKIVDSGIILDIGGCFKCPKFVRRAWPHLTPVIFF